MKYFKSMIVIPFSILFVSCASNHDLNWTNEQPVKSKVRFEENIAPIIADNCISCHQAVYYINGKKIKPKEGLRLDAKEFLLDEQLIIPGNAEESGLYLAIIPQKHPLTRKLDQMPPSKSGGPLKKSDAALIRDWINQGADFSNWEKFDKEILRKHRRESIEDQ